jgi:polyvinyl alcohol dehydrogenase (cytochrome)
MNRSARLIAAFFALLIAGCEDARTQYARSLGTAPPVGPPPQAPRNDWLTFAHDPLRSGFQPQLTGLDATNVGSLRLRWVHRLGEPLKASPLVTPLRVYLAGQQGTVQALDVRTGRVLWATHLGGDIDMTPAVGDGLLFVGVRTMPGTFAALSTTTGAVKWRASFPGGVRAEPVVFHGVVYEGETGGDSPHCGHGGVHALDERTGRLLWSWYVAPRAHLGGSVWSPLGFDGTHLIFGTGNGCVPGLDAADAIVALDLHGRRVWSHPVAPSNSDNDFGGGTLLMHGQAIATNKDGMLYDLNAATGDLVWSTPMGGAPGYGGIGTPTSDGATIVASAGFLHDPTKTTWPPGGALIAYDTAGRQKWEVTTKDNFPGAAAIEGGLAFAALYDRFVAIDLSNGSLLWSYPNGGSAYASPAVVPSGVYFANDAGMVFAFSRSRP